jgi:hypothetical protein
VFRGDYLDSFGLDRICEELEAVTALAGEYQVPWELFDVVRRTYRRALARFGPADGELLAVSLLDDEAGRKLLSAQLASPSGPAHARPHEKEMPADGCYAGRGSKARRPHSGLSRPAWPDAAQRIRRPAGGRLRPR